MASTKSLESFLATHHPTIKTYTRSHADFDKVAENFVVTKNKPLLIARPGSESDVAALVDFLTKTNIPFAVRAGGHDLFSRSAPDGAVQIDLRDIAHVRVSPDRKTARIGGGILQFDLLKALAEDGLACACGSVGTVGWVGWASLGGYGMFGPSLGMGCDQIYNARVVLADGNVVDADERLLKAIRGAGPAFGVITEVEIKVFPCKEIQSGIIAYDSKDIASSISTFYSNLSSLVESNSQELPPELYLQVAVMEVPPQGLTFMSTVAWTAEASEESQAWITKVAGLAPGGVPMIGPKAPWEHVKTVTDLVPPRLYPGKFRTATLRSIIPSPKAVRVMAEIAPKQPQNGGTMFAMHVCRGAGTRPSLPSAFVNRETHLMLEIAGVTAVESKAEEGARWADELWTAIKGVEGSTDLVYYSTADPEGLDLENVYGKEILSELRDLKRELDPGNVFRFPAVVV